MAEYDLDDIMPWLRRRGRATEAFNEILSILHDNLPQVLVHLSLPAVKTWDYAGVELDPGKIPAVLVGGSIRTENLGTDFGDTGHILVTCAYMPVITRRQLQDSLDITQCISGLLSMPGIAGPRTNGDKTFWNWLLPTGYSLVPPNFPQYSGWIAEFSMLQSPENQLWPEA